ncbi:MAG: extracellular solute-binding protein [Clostridiales bacterium]|nr:extracellular solute-binding protein [Clostridiales bacterium]
MKNKLVALILSVIMVFSVMAPALATTVVYHTSSSMAVSDEDSASTTIMSAVAVGSKIYALYGNGDMTAQDAASGEETVIGNVAAAVVLMPEELFELDGKLYGFNVQSGEWYLLVDEQGTFVQQKQDVTLDTSLFAFDEGEYSSYLQFKSVFGMDGWLYYAGISYAEIYSMRSGRINLETGEGKEFTTKAIKELVPYQDGMLLALIYDDSAMYSGSISTESLSQNAQLMVFDPQKDAAVSQVEITSETSMGGYGVAGLCAGDKGVFYRDGARVKGMDMATGTSRISAYTGGSTYDGMNARAFYADGYYAYYSYEGLSCLMLDSESLLDGVLTIYGEMGGDSHKSFVKNHPEIPVDITTNSSSDLESLTQAMVSGDQTLDVLELYTTYMPVDRLIQKGYCLDLSEYTEITSRVEQMYPQFVDAITVDGKLYGVPINAYGTTFGVNMELWAELGLTEDDLPTSVCGLLEFISNWSYDYGDEYSEVQLFEFNQIGDLLFSLILQQYMTYTAYTGEDLRFDTPEFREVMEAFEAIDFSELESASGEDDEQIYYYMQDSLFTMSQTVGMFYGNMRMNNIQALPLPLLDGQDAVITTLLSVMIINPKSSRIDEAVKYVVNYLDNLDKNSANITLFPDHNEPLEADHYQSSVKSCNEAIEKTKAQLENADAENKAELEDQLTNLQNELELIESNRYDASPEMLQDYRENLAPLLVAQGQNALYSAESAAVTEVNQLLLKYLDGAITLDQMIKDFDQRIKMMELEAQ